MVISLMTFFRKRVYAGYNGPYSRPMKWSRFSTPTSRVRQFNRRTLTGPKTRGPLQSQVKSLQSVVKKLAPEIKYDETDISATNITSTGAVVHLTPIAQGDTQDTRTGNTINVVSLAVRGAFVFASDAPVDGSCRILIVKDNQQIADTTPTAQDIIDDSFFTANPVVNLPNDLNFGRFSILYSSKLYVLRRMGLNTSVFGVPTQSHNFEYNWSGNIKVSYNGNSAGDIQKNGLYFVILSDASGSTLDFAGITRLGYCDA